MEFWDIYDANKERTGRTMKRNDWILQDGEYHLTVLGVVKRTDGKFLITKRVMTKAWAPGWWEVSGGAAQAGEDSKDAVRRRFFLLLTGFCGNGSEAAGSRNRRLYAGNCAGNRCTWKRGQVPAL